MQMKEYRISDLFEKIEVQKIQGKANDFPTQKDNAHNIPLLTSTGSNQGFSRYAAKEDCPTILQDVISIASNGDAGATFYQAEPFAVLQDAYAIQLKVRKMTEAIGLYLAATIRKAIYDTHDWVNKAGWSNIEDSIITLPSVTHIVPDWAMMAKIGGGGEMNDFDTSMWREFKVKDVLGNAKLGKYHNPETLHEDANGYLYICASAQNNGVNKQMPRVNGENLSITPSKIISWGKQCPMFTYHDEPCVTGQGIYYLDMSKYDEKVSLFICAVLKRAIGNAFGYTNCLIGSILDDIKIKLPATEINEPDWNYMQERIAELEQERIAELEHYLIATGLNDYELTEEDKQILATKLTDGGASQSSESGNDYWKEAWLFRIGDLFEVKTPARKFNANTVEITDKIGHPYVVRSSINNGIRGYINEDERYLNEGHTFSFGQDTATIFWQEKPYFTGDKIKVLKPKFVCDFEIANYIINEITKTFCNFSWGAQSFKQSTIENSKILLPITCNRKPDWDFMRKYIHAIEKVVIADVVKYKDEVIAKTKTIAQ